MSMRELMQGAEPSEILQLIRQNTRDVQPRFEAGSTGDGGVADGMRSVHAQVAQALEHADGRVITADSVMADIEQTSYGRFALRTELRKKCMRLFVEYLITMMPKRVTIHDIMLATGMPVDSVYNVVNSLNRIKVSSIRFCQQRDYQMREGRRVTVSYFWFVH